MWQPLALIATVVVVVACSSGAAATPEPAAAPSSRLAAPGAAPEFKIGPALSQQLAECTTALVFLVAGQTGLQVERMSVSLPGAEEAYTQIGPPGARWQVMSDQIDGGTAPGDLLQEHCGGVIEQTRLAELVDSAS